MLMRLSMRSRGWSSLTILGRHESQVPDHRLTGQMFRQEVGWVILTLNLKKGELFSSQLFLNPEAIDGKMPLGPQSDPLADALRCGGICVYT